jgi:hypothetical protein
MFIFAGVALVAFVGYFIVALHFLPLNMRVASLTLDIGLSSSVVGIISAIVAARQNQACRSQIIMCAVVGVFLVVVSAFALYATRAI